MLDSLSDVGPFFLQALVSIRRMQAFLNASELDPCSVQRKAKECMSGDDINFERGLASLAQNILMYNIVVLQTTLPLVSKREISLGQLMKLLCSRGRFLIV